MGDKFGKGQILVASDKRTNGKSYYRFWEVTRATTNTCEIIELKVQIVRQVGDLQEVMPWKNNYACETPVRFKTMGKIILLEKNLFATPWDGKSRFQQALIYYFTD